MSKYDFSRMRYQINSLSKDVRVVDIFPELGKYKDLKPVGVMNADTLLRYVIYAYDMGSPFHKAGETQKRKLLAMEECGLKKPNTTFSDLDDELMDILRGKNQDVNAMAVQIIRLQNNVKFTLLMAQNDNYYYGIFLLMSNKNSLGDPIKDATDKNKFSETLTSMATAIEKLSKEVFYDEPELMAEANDVMAEEDGYIGVCERYALPARQ